MRAKNFFSFLDCQRLGRKVFRNEEILVFSDSIPIVVFFDVSFFRESPKQSIESIQVDDSNLKLFSEFVIGSWQMTVGVG